MGNWQTRGHGHCQFPSEQRTILEDYVKKFLVGGGTSDAKMLRADAAKTDLAAWTDWTAPALQ